MKPNANTPQSENTIISKEPRRMLGFGLAWWNAAMLWSLGLAALAAMAVLVTTRAVIVLQSQETEEKAKQLSDATLDASHAVLQTTILAKEVAEANERAASLEKEAAEARLE